MQADRKRLENSDQLVVFCFEIHSKTHDSSCNKENGGQAINDGCHMFSFDPYRGDAHECYQYAKATGEGTVRDGSRDTAVDLSSGQADRRSNYYCCEDELCIQLIMFLVIYEGYR